MSLGGPEILVIIVIALLVLGPDKIPAAMRTAGKVFGEVKKYQNMAKTEIDKAMTMATIDSENDNSKTKEKIKTTAIEEPKEESPKNKDTDELKKVKPIIDEEEPDSI